MTETHPWITVIIICLITFLDFFVALAKSAFEHVNENALEEDSKDEPVLDSGTEKMALEASDRSLKSQRALNALDFIEKKERGFYNACWLIRGIAWIVIGMLFAFNVFPVMSFNLMKLMGVSDLTRIIRWAICIISTIALIFLEVLFSYILPDRLGNRNTESLFYRMFGFMRFITVLFTPLSAMLEFACAILLAPFGIRLEDLEEKVSEEEIISIVNEGQENGVIDDNEAEMISNIINFDETLTKDIMTHKTKVIAIDSSMTVEEAMGFMTEEAFSRFPLFEESIDNIIGVLYLKDVAKCVASGKAKERSLRDIARKPFFVPDTMTIDALFNQMQAKKTHMAIVVDEYGQTAGIVAMEDILEEIVGEIEDEFDNEDQMIIRAKDGTFFVRGEADLHEIAEETGFAIEEAVLDSFMTLNGLVVNLLGHIPADGEKVNLEYRDFVIEILSAKGKLIRKCRLRKK